MNSINAFLFGITPCVCGWGFFPRWFEFPESGLLFHFFRLLAVFQDFLPSPLLFLPTYFFTPSGGRSHPLGQPPVHYRIDVNITSRSCHALPKKRVIRGRRTHLSLRPRHNGTRIFDRINGSTTLINPCEWVCCTESNRPSPDGCAKEMIT